MKRSSDRILTTHVGSLPRPLDLLQMNDAKGSGHSVDQSAWRARVKTAVVEVVRLQRESGVDIVNDGELSKSSWSSYVNERLSGFAESVSQGQGSLAKGRDKRAFQEFYDEYDRIQPSEPSMARAGPTSFVMRRSSTRGSLQSTWTQKT